MTQASTSDVPALLRLEVLEGPVKGKVLHKKGLTLIKVGRTSKSPFFIKDSTVSESHAVLAWQDGRWALRDVGSSNGTELNGAALEAEGEFVPLKDGDLIKFGTESVCKVEIVAVPREDLTVEAFVEAEIEQLEQRLRARAEQVANQLRQEWREVKQTLIAA